MVGGKLLRELREEKEEGKRQKGERWKGERMKKEASSAWGTIDSLDEEENCLSLD